MSEAKASTGFVIRATSADDLAMWVCPPRFGEHRVFGPRENAEVFKTRGAARAVIGRLPISFEQAGFTFSVEAAE